MTQRILIAGVGNIFFGDDGFGVRVADRLSRENLPAGVSVADFGIRSVHLAYELLNGYDALILIDAVSRHEEPGSLYVIDANDVPEGESTELKATMDGHGLTPEAVLSLCESLGGKVDTVLVIGCEPADCGSGIGLSGPIELAIEGAVRLVHECLGALRYPVGSGLENEPGD